MTGTVWETQRERLYRVLRAWMNHPNSPHVSVAQARRLVEAEFSPIEEHGLQRMLVHGDPTFDMCDKNKWIVGPTIDIQHPAIPVATVAVAEHDNTIKATIRVALLFEQDGVVNADGYRFETAEGPGKPHIYPHAQAVSGWHPRKPCLMHAHGSDDDVSDCLKLRAIDLGVANIGDDSQIRMPVVNEQRPAFPLALGKTLPGLATAMLVALYGAVDARAMVETDSTLIGEADAEIRSDLQFVLSQA